MISDMNYLFVEWAFGAYRTVLDCHQTKPTFPNRWELVVVLAVPMQVEMPVVVSYLPNHCLLLAVEKAF